MPVIVRCRENECENRSGREQNSEDDYSKLKKKTPLFRGRENKGTIDKDSDPEEAKENPHYGGLLSVRGYRLLYLHSTGYIVARIKK